MLNMEETIIFRKDYVDMEWAESHKIEHYSISIYKPYEKDRKDKSKDCKYIIDYNGYVLKIVLEQMEFVKKYGVSEFKRQIFTDDLEQAVNIVNEIKEILIDYTQKGDKREEYSKVI